MASNEVIFEEFQLQDTIAAIYVLDKTLYGHAKYLAQFLTQDSVIKLCKEYQEHLKHTVVETFDSLKECTQNKTHDTISLDKKINANSVSIRDYGYLERLKTEAKIRDEGHGLHHDVVIILGHTSVMLAEDKDLIAAFGKIKPTIIAFLGCCGGNSRYGPILTMSYLLPSEKLPSKKSQYAYEGHHILINKPILAFYQRQVYTDELLHTSLVIGLKYYLHLKNTPDFKNSNSFLKAQCAFALAKCVKSVLPTDPTIFVNDRVAFENNDVQLLLDKCDLKAEGVPLSCMQLALYYPMMVDPNLEFRSGKSKTPIKFRNFKLKLPEEPYPEHRLPIDDVLWQLGQQRIKITIRGVTQETIYNFVQELSEINISKIFPKKITITEDPRNLDSQKYTEVSKVSKHIENIKITFQKRDDSSKMTIKDEHSVKITLSTRKSGEHFLSNISVSQTSDQSIKISWETMFRFAVKISIYHRKDAQESSIYIIETGSQGITGNELSQECWDKIEKLGLHEIIPLACEIEFIKLFESTKQLMWEGSWEETDDLQFLIAVLRGHWGKNSLTTIKSWAIYHFKKIMNNVQETKTNSEILHKYKLCCTCFVLIFADSFIRFVGSDNKYYGNYKIIVCTKDKDKLVDVIKTDQLPPDLPNNNPIPFPKDKPLSGWVDLFKHCNYINDCVRLYNDARHPAWTIGNQYANQNADQNGDPYNYNYDELLLTMGALSDGCLDLNKDKAERAKIYNVKNFFNEDRQNQRYMKYFNDSPERLDSWEVIRDLTITKTSRYIEAKVLLNSKCTEVNLENRETIERLVQIYEKDPAMWHVANDYHLVYAKERSKAKEGLSTLENWQKVSSCRLVLAQFPTQTTSTNSKIRGILFYTDTHYGYNLIVYNKAQLQELSKCTGKPKCFDKLPRALKIPSERREGRVSTRDWIRGTKRETLCGPCRYRLLEITIKEMKIQSKFPFTKIGRLTLTYNDKNELTELELHPCEERTTTQQ